MSASGVSANGYGVSTSMWTHGEVCQAGRTRQRDRFFYCRCVSARVHAMEAAAWYFTSLEEVEDLAIEAVKIILHRDTEKPRQLGVDLDIPEVATSGLLLSQWVPRFWRAWRHEQKHTSAGSACTVDVTSASRTQFAWRDVRQILIVGNVGYDFASIGIGAEILNCSSSDVFPCKKLISHGAMGAEVAVVIFFPVFLIC